MNDDLGRLRQDLLAPDDGGAGPRRIGRYDIVREISRGGMGIVYEAFDPPLRRRVALKVVTGGPGREALLRRLSQEAAAVARLRHPNIVSIYETGTFEESPGLQSQFIAMDYIEGGTLADQMHFLSRRERLAVLQIVALAADFAHEQGIVHRDLKPQNVLMERLTGTGAASVAQRVYLSDFGLAKIEGEDLTRTGSVLGTAAYMAPEQVRGEGKLIGPRTDVWALGVILYQMLTDRRPFDGPTPLEIYERIVGVDPIPPRRHSPAIAPDLETVCLKALEKDSERRYPSAAAFAEDLRRCLDGEAILAKPASTLSRIWRKSVKHRRLIAAAVVGVAALAAAGTLMLGRLHQAGVEEKRREDAVKAVERARGPLDRAWTLMYRADSDMEAIRRQAAAAMPELDAALKAWPDLAPARSLKGWAWEIQGFEDLAEKEYREAVRIDPRCGPAHERLGRLLVARCHLMLMATTNPAGSSVAERDMIAVAEEARAEFAAAEACAAGLDVAVHVRVAERLLEVLKSRKPPEVDPDIAAFEGRDGVEQLWLLKAMFAPGIEARTKAADKALEIRPKFPMAYLSKSLLYQNLGAPDKALKELEAALVLHPRFGKAFISRAEIRRMRGDVDGALADYARALELDPADWQALDLRCVCHVGRGDLERAKADLAASIRIHPGHAFSWLCRAQIQVAEGDREKAIESLGEGLKISPDMPALHYQRAVLYFMQGRLQDSNTDVDAATKLRNGLYPEALLLKAQLHLAVGNFQAAWTVAEAVSRAMPGHAPAANLVMGQAALALNRATEAVDCFTRALVGSTSPGDILLLRARARALLADTAGAEADLVEALRLLPANHPGRKAAAEALDELRRRQGSQEH